MPTDTGLLAMRRSLLCPFEDKQSLDGFTALLRNALTIDHLPRRKITRVSSCATGVHMSI